MTARIRTGWASWLARFSMAALKFETLSGLAITFVPFYTVVQHNLWEMVGVCVGERAVRESRKHGKGGKR